MKDDPAKKNVHYLNLLSLAEQASRLPKIIKPHWIQFPETKYIMLFSDAELELRSMGHERVAAISQIACEIMIEIVEKMDAENRRGGFEKP